MRFALGLGLCVLVFGLFLGCTKDSEAHETTYSVVMSDAPVYHSSHTVVTRRWGWPVINRMRERRARRWVHEASYGSNGTYGVSYGSNGTYGAVSYGSAGNGVSYYSGGWGSTGG